MCVCVCVCACVCVNSELAGDDALGTRDEVGEEELPQHLPRRFLGVGRLDAGGAEEQLQELVKHHLACLVVRVLLGKEFSVASDRAEALDALFDVERGVEHLHLLRHRDNVVETHGHVEGADDVAARLARFVRGQEVLKHLAETTLVGGFPDELLHRGRAEVEEEAIRLLVHGIWPHQVLYEILEALRHRALAHADVGDAHEGLQ
mmetsp:Transcript_48803/g.99655  ORF Transcript_48803/g.99655 Transcript_48803/m.99655 type:complete len:205 (-) Transcript_48803:19-633(-)